MDILASGNPDLLNFLQIIAKIPWFVPMVILIAILGAVLQLPQVIGRVGEWKLRFGLWLFLRQDVYTRFNNVILQLGPGETTEIDHVIVSRHGIFVIETKNWGGAIYGCEHEHQWTQKIGRLTRRHQNPIRQNQKHVAALISVLRLPPQHVHPIIAFVGNGRLKTPMPHYVLTGGWVPYIKEFRPVVLSENDVLMICQHLQSLQGTVSYAEHVANLQRKRGSYPAASQDANAETIQPQGTVELPESATQPPPCPSCGSPMVMRTSRSNGSQIWGCPKFPRCRGKRAV